MKGLNQVFCRDESIMVAVEMMKGKSKILFADHLSLVYCGSQKLGI